MPGMLSHVKAPEQQVKSEYKQHVKHHPDFLINSLVSPHFDKVQQKLVLPFI